MRFLFDLEKESSIFSKQSKFKKQFLHISYNYALWASEIHCARLSYARFGKIVATAECFRQELHSVCSFKNIIKKSQYGTL